MMKQTATQLSLPIEVFGPETHMTAIVSMALGKPIKITKPLLVPDVQHTRTHTLAPRSDALHADTDLTRPGRRWGASLPLPPIRWKHSNPDVAVTTARTV